MKCKTVLFWGILLLFFVAAEIFCCQLYLSHSINRRPKVQLPKELMYDFGQVMEGEKVEHSYIFKNIGRETLKILNVKTGCGCTHAQVNKTEIVPGESCNVQITYIARRVRDRDTVESYIQTNDPENPLLVFGLTGIIKYRVFWFPESVSFFGKTSEVTTIKEIRFLNQRDSKDPLELEIFSISSDYINVQFVQDKEETIAKIALSPECPQGSYVENIAIKYSKDELNKPINVPVYIMLH